MILLDALHREFHFLERADGFHAGLGGGEVGGVGDLLGDGGGADLDFVLAGYFTRLISRANHDEEPQKRPSVSLSSTSSERPDGSTLMPALVVCFAAQNQAPWFRRNEPHRAINSRTGHAGRTTDTNGKSPGWASIPLKRNRAVIRIHSQIRIGNGSGKSQYHLSCLIQRRHRNGRNFGSIPATT